MIKIIYGNFEEGIEENLSFSNDTQNWASISKPQNVLKNNVIYKNFGNPCEDYSVLLDGKSLPLPDDDSENMGLWSNVPSNSLKSFGNDEDILPFIDIISDEVLSTNAIGFEFDKYNNVYATHVTVDFLKYNSTFSKYDIVSSDDVYPDNPLYFYKKLIIGYDRIKIRFFKLNTPNVRLKLRSIKFGFQSEILGNRIKNIKISQKINPISTNIPISSSDISLSSVLEIQENFSVREIMKIYNNDTLIGKFFISEANKINKSQWNIRVVDYISLLDTNDFVGGIYENKNAGELLTEIFESANVPFSISESLSEKTVSGYIPYTSCRNALQQVLIAIGAFATTAYSQNVDIIEIDETISAEIPLSQIMTGQSVDTETELTELEIYMHKYEETLDETSLFKSDTVTNFVKIIFSEPIHSLSITNGEILESGTNYAIINCQNECELVGKKYKHTQTAKSIKKDGYIISPNKKTISEATLISIDNIDNVLNLCYNYLRRNNSAKSKIVEKNTILNLGKNYSVDTEMIGTITGTLIEQSFNLNSGKIYKDTIIK